VVRVLSDEGGRNMLGVLQIEEALALATVSAGPCM
jgi:hypothetical protein